MQMPRCIIVTIVTIVIINDDQPSQARRFFSQVRSLASTFCSGSPGDCGSAERFRRIDGACNNLARPQVGVLSMSCMIIMIILIILFTMISIHANHDEQDDYDDLRIDVVSHPL